MDNKKRRLLPATLITKDIFSLIGFLFVILFTLRGICQVIYIFAYHSAITDAAQSGNASESYFMILLKAMKSQNIAVLDTMLMILCGLILIHGILGVIYAIKTDYKIRKMLKGKVWFYLQIISVVAAGFVVMAIMNSTGEIKVHSTISWILTFFAALLGAFHFANGFYNACITLGISVSGKSKRAARIFECIVAVFSLLQIFILLI